MAVTDLSEVELRHPDGTPTKLGDIVDRPTIIHRLRYYGCPPCLVHLDKMAARHHDVHEMGGAMLGVGPASARQATALRRRGIPFELLLDPDHDLSEAIGQQRQSLIHFLIDVRGWWRWLRAVLRRWQGKITGGWWELPAVVVLDEACVVRWAYRGRFMGDYPPLSHVIDELERLLDGSPE